MPGKRETAMVNRGIWNVCNSECQMDADLSGKRGRGHFGSVIFILWTCSALKQDASFMFYRAVMFLKRKGKNP